ncbi:MAG: tRNA (adenosine(37)-N6)-threonylcarbamoyltransferase complex ATPase subunit type 1 TsaE [Flavicella sp.]
MTIQYNLEDLSEVAAKILTASKHKTLLFYGEMGLGKTTLIKELVKQLGVKDTASSPTFSLVNEYQSSNYETVYHFDFYRINNEEEAYDIGIEDYFNSDAWCLIEWPSSIKNLLPLESTSLYLTINEDNSRNLRIENHTK